MEQWTGVPFRKYPDVSERTDMSDDTHCVTPSLGRCEQAYLTTDREPMSDQSNNTSKSVLVDLWIYLGLQKFGWEVNYRSKNNSGNYITQSYTNLTIAHEIWIPEITGQSQLIGVSFPGSSTGLSISQKSLMLIWHWKDKGEGSIHWSASGTPWSFWVVYFLNVNQLLRRMEHFTPL